MNGLNGSTIIGLKLLNTFNVQASQVPNTTHIHLQGLSIFEVVVVCFKAKYAFVRLKNLFVMIIITNRVNCALCILHYKKILLT